MVQNVLAWSTLGLSILFMLLSLTVIFGRASLGASALTVVAPLAIGTLAVAILLAVAMLVLSLVQ